MISFVTASNSHICPLPGILQELTTSLTQLTLDSIFDTDDDYNTIMANPTSAQCMLNMSLALVEEQRNEIQSSLERQLEEMSLLSQSFGLSREVLDVMRHYTFSPSCVAGLVNMRYCPLCAGYGEFRPCLYMCINTLQGCFADMAEMHSDFTQLNSAMEKLAEGLINEFSPEIFTQSYMNQFVVMVQELRKKQEDLTEAVSSYNCASHLCSYW